MLRRFLGIDYGTKRIGLSLSDEGGILAFPEKIIRNDANLFHNLEEVIKEKKIGAIIIGESLSLSGRPNPVNKKISELGKEIKERFQIEVHKEKEFLTSVEARRSASGKEVLNVPGAHSRMKKPKMDKVDASAAALILQRYLDRINKK